MKEADAISHIFHKKNFSFENILKYKELYPQYSDFIWMDGGGITKIGETTDYSCAFL